MKFTQEPERAKAALVTMWTIRRFEEAVDELFGRGLMHGTMHLSIGQEASATGGCLSLRDDVASHLLLTCDDDDALVVATIRSPARR